MHQRETETETDVFRNGFIDICIVVFFDAGVAVKVLVAFENFLRRRFSYQLEHFLPTVIRDIPERSRTRYLVIETPKQLTGKSRRNQDAVEFFGLNFLTVCMKNSPNSRPILVPSPPIAVHSGRDSVIHGNSSKDAGM